MRLFALCFCATAALAQTLPTGFSSEIAVTGLINSPVGFGIAPDGRFFTVGRPGWVRVAPPSGGASTMIGQLPDVLVVSNSGAQDVVVDPGWPTRPYLYFYWTQGTPRSKKLSRFTVTGAVNDPSSTALALTDEWTLLSGIPDVTGIHNGGELLFGPDGFLYMTLGEDFSQCQAQDLSNFLGGVLRMDVSSLPPGPGASGLADLVAAGNPLAGPTDESRLLYAWGLRNPWRMVIDPFTGWLYPGDVGSDFVDEISEVTGPGQNLGWPFLEGPGAYSNCPGLSATGLTDPVVAFAHPVTPGPVVIMPLALYRNVPGSPYNFGPEYEGDLFYRLIHQGWLRRVVRTGGTFVPAAPVAGQPNASDWGVGYTTIPFDAQLGADGAIYLLEGWPSHRIVRIRGSAPSLLAISGDGAVGNASSAVQTPIIAELRNSAGQPMVGVPVTFAYEVGAGTFSDVTVVTAANGQALTYAIPDAGLGARRVVATAIGAVSAHFDLLVRGLEVTFDGPTSTLELTVLHSRGATPVTLAVDLSPGLSIPTPVGVIVTNILGPAAPLAWLDGLGILGPPDPVVVTDVAGTFALAFGGLPPFGGASLVFQAYSVDTTRPGAEQVLISNPVTLTLP